MHMHVVRFISHHSTDKCYQAIEMRLQRHDVEIYHRVGDMKFRLYDKEGGKLIEGAMQLNYLCMMLGETDSDSQAVQRNITKAREILRRLEKLLRWEVGIHMGVRLVTQYSGSGGPTIRVRVLVDFRCNYLGDRGISC